MNDYTGKICPYCKTAFKPDDEIVVCSECDMPHHKDCWIENQAVPPLVASEQSRQLTMTTVRLQPEK